LHANRGKRSEANKKSLQEVHINPPDYGMIKY